LNLSNIKVVHYQLVGQDRNNLFVEPTLEMGLCPECNQGTTAIHEIGEPQMVRDFGHLGPAVLAAFGTPALQVP
jgi:hypothetical protein